MRGEHASIYIAKTFTQRLAYYLVLTTVRTRYEVNGGPKFGHFISSTSKVVAAPDAGRPRLTGMRRFSSQRLC